MRLTFLFFAAILLFSCSDSETEFIDEIEFKTLEAEILLNNSFELNFGESDESFLIFEIIKLDIGNGIRVKPSDKVQILDNSTYGYPDALAENEIIKEGNAWSLNDNFVLGTSVGHGGLFEDNGPSYLGFRIVEDDNFQYGWVLLDNNAGNTKLQIMSYGINRTSNRAILSGQKE